MWTRLALNQASSLPTPSPPCAKNWQCKSIPGLLKPLSFLITGCHAREAQLQLLLCWFFFFVCLFVFLSQGCPSLILGHFSLCFNNLGGDFHSWMYLPLCFTWNFPKMVTSMSPTPLALLQCDTQSYLEEGCGFSIIMYGCESWTIKKAEHRRIDAFELWCWRRLLTVPWTARRVNQSILKEISPEYSLEGLMLKL